MRVPPDAVLALVAVLPALACSSVAEVPTDDLVRVVTRDAVPFDGSALPPSVIDFLADSRVILVGETHWLREHRLLMADLIRTLHHRGFRQMLVEWPQMVDRALDDYVNDGGLYAEWEPGESFGASIATAVREFNRTLPTGSHVQVRAIDANLTDYGGRSSFLEIFRDYVDRLPSAAAIQNFFRPGPATSEEHARRIDALQAALAADRGTLVQAWGPAAYGAVAEMVDVEKVSIGIRALYQNNYDAAARLREDLIKRLADLRLDGYPYNSLINVGGSHAQKSRMRGTDQQWLGDYLVHESRAAGGPVVVLGVTAARIEPEPGASGSFDVADASPRNEIFRVMSEAYPGRNVYLPLSDPLFGRGGVPMNYEGTIYVGSPSHVYDALLQYGMAHYIPIR